MISEKSCDAAQRRQLDNSTPGILKSQGGIAINQDPLGIAGDLVWKQGPAEVYLINTPGCYMQNFFAPSTPRVCAWRGRIANPVDCCEIEQKAHAKELAHTQVYAGPLAGGARAVVLSNRHHFADMDNMQNINVT